MKGAALDSLGVENSMQIAVREARDCNTILHEFMKHWYLAVIKSRGIRGFVIMSIIRLVLAAMMHNYYIYIYISISQYIQ